MAPRVDLNQDVGRRDPGVAAQELHFRRPQAFGLVFGHERGNHQAAQVDVHVGSVTA